MNRKPPFDQQEVTWGWDPLLGRAEQAVDRAAQIPVEHAEVYIRRGNLTSVEVEPADGSTKRARGEECRVEARVWTGGRMGWAAGADPGQLEAVVDAARAAAPHGPVAAPPPAGVRGTWPTAAGAAEPAASGLAAEVLQGLRPLAPVWQAVLVHEWSGAVAVVSSSGTRAFEALRSHRILVRLETEHGALVDGWSTARGGARECPPPVVERLREALRAAAGGEVRGVDDLPLHLAPAVAAPLVAAFGAGVLRAEAALVQPGLMRAVGKRVFSPALTVVDDPGDDCGPGPRRFDDEGTAAQPLTLIDQGRLVGFAHSASTATAAGVASNGRGLRTGSAVVGSGFLGLGLRASTDAVPPDRLELTTRFEPFTHGARAGQVEISCCGWEVRGGQRVRPVGPLVLVFPVLDAFRRLLAAAGEPEALASLGGQRLPHLLFEPGVAKRGAAR
jgi:PmbA protein